MNTKKLTPTERKLLRKVRKEMKDWQPHDAVYNAGDLFEIYHNILMFKTSRMYRDIVQNYWNTFFREHELPEYSVKDEVLDICYIANADLIFERVKDELKNKLNKINTLV